MSKFQITARRINDRPDQDGWMSSGHELPTFWVEGAAVTDAAAIGHDVAGHGVAGITRTTLQVYRVKDDGSEEFHDSTAWWADGRKVNPTKVKRQYGKDGNDITGQQYAETDADAVTWFTADGGVWLRVTRTPRDRWAVETSDYVGFKVSDYRRRGGKADDMLRLAEQRAGAVVVEVQEW